MIHVYLLKDGNGKVVDVGQSKDPASRLYAKTKVIGKSNMLCSFYGRTDITQEVLLNYPTRSEALLEEKRLKLYYGLEHTEAIGLNKMNESPIAKNRKLTFKDATEIRSKYIPRKYDMRMLAKEYGVTPPVIYLIIHNKTYKE